MSQHINCPYCTAPIQDRNGKDLYHGDKLPELMHCPKCGAVLSRKDMEETIS